HTATLLANGQVLVAGGQGNGNAYLSSAEIYDPNTGVWTNTGSMTIPHDVHTATLLSGGRVLVAGGLTTGMITNVAELYDPATGNWTATGKLNGVRDLHSATLLPDGSVLVCGGIGNIAGGTNTAEVYEPATGLWTRTNSMSSARYYQTATLLANGSVLVVGGNKSGTGFLASAEIYDGSTNGVFVSTGSMNPSHSNFSASILADGKVLVEGGFGTAGTNAEVYDPAVGTWTSTSVLNTYHRLHSSTLLPTGGVLIAGGKNANELAITNCELFDPNTGTWSVAGPLNQKRAGQTATLLPDGAVLVAGGYTNGNPSSGYLAGAELYDPNTGTWTVTGSMSTNRIGHTATLLPNGKVLVAGGAPDGTHALATAELYDPVTGAWTPTGSMTVKREDHTATLLPNGKVLVAGGGDYSGMGITPTATAELYDPSSGTWTATTSMSTGRYSHAAVLLPNGRVLVAGGSTGSSLLSSVEIYDPATASWKSNASMLTASINCRLFTLADGTVLMVGSDTELFKLAPGSNNSWQPQIVGMAPSLNPGDRLSVTGTGFCGVSEGSGGNSQNSSTAYPLVQLRSIESGRTMFVATTNWTANGLVSAAVWNFPPGWAMATVFANGIQSTSVFVNVNVPVAAVSNTTGSVAFQHGFQFTFTNTPGAVMGMLMTTNLSLPATNWVRMSGVTEIAPGQFQFSDPQASTNSGRFYRLFAP
ncbi:MAG TPA: kelch repeat-containing protein, partial [Verrucomicrobiae bacterium]|nr:kelch repeat-containing protein [Verrucomicrobiae bacterium]